MTTCDTEAMKVRKTIDIEIPGLGEKIEATRRADARTLRDICGQVNMTTANWHRIEKEETKFLPIETLREIERVLGVDFGIEI